MLHARTPLLLLLGVFAADFGPTAASAGAQYFGRNQVRYHTFDFRVLKTPHFDLYYYPTESRAAELAARLAERWYVRLSHLLNHQLSRRQPVILYASAPHFQQTTAVFGVGEGIGGVTEPFKRRVVLPFAGPLAETDHVLGHELVHAFQFDITERQGAVFAPPTATAMPLWFVEGMAEYLSLGPVDPHTAMWMRDAAREKKLPTFKQLYDPRFFPYRYGQALWAYIAGRWGDPIVGEILRRSASTGAVIPTMATVLGLSPDSLVRDWQKATEQMYAGLADSTCAPGDYGRSLLAPEGGDPRGRLNIAPAVSPDGNSLVFLSERSRVAVEMFLADAQTGTIKRKIVKTALDPHFESLEFISSAGAWNPDGRRFAFAGVSSGRPVVSVLDVDRGAIEREFTIREADEVFTPTWSPDGTRLAFSGLTGGLLDLFLLDTHTGAVRHLTDDAFADLQPAWSPDGKSIAFVTDRFTTDLATLSGGDYRLALLDPASGQLRELQGFANAKNINPQWSPDGASIYFLSDRNGITNVYRLNLGTQDVSQVTNLLTGVSGITALSPALSVAQRAQRMAFSVYHSGRYDIYAVDSAAVLAGARPTPLAGSNAATLPPADRKPSDIDSLLAHPLAGLPPDSGLTSAKYHGGLSLDFVSPVNVGVGSGGAFGPAIGGGSALFWGDMLGQQHLTTALQVFGGFDDISALVAYQNLRSRWTWGLVAGQTPFISLGFRRTTTNPSPDTTATVDSLYRFRQTDRQATAVLAYPFSRVQRIEFTAGYRASGYREQVVTRRIATPSGGGPGRITFTDAADLAAPSRISQIEASVALVRDNALFGPASPALGGRYRFAVAPSIGDLTYYTILADYRRYIRPVRPYTFAIRLLHYGRYGTDSDDGRLFPLFLGYQTFLRGYSFTSFDLSGCPAIIRSPTDCPVPVFRELLGSRMALANFEFRMPLFEGLGLEQPAGLPYLEVAPFFDAGVAWLRTDKPRFLGGDRNVLSSYGAALRITLFGAAVLEFDLVHANDRPGKRWYTQFGLAPGF